LNEPGALALRARKVLDPPTRLLLFIRPSVVSNIRRFGPVRFRFAPVLFRFAPVRFNFDPNFPAEIFIYILLDIFFLIK
jgi:hypothetical protein